MNEWDTAKIESNLAQKKIVWNFNQPESPHYGKIREILNQKSKSVIKAIFGNGSLFDDLLSKKRVFLSKQSTQEPWQQ